MKRIILCEGKTDSILISYFLLKTFGWSHMKHQSRERDFPIDDGNEQFNVYSHPEKTNQDLGIWGGKGLEDLPRKLGLVAERNRDERDPSRRYDRIVLFFDRDSRSEDDCISLVRTWLQKANIYVPTGRDLILGAWFPTFTNLNLSPPKRYDQELLCIVLPPGANGALETFLLDCLKNESASDKHLVDEADKFIVTIPATPYLPQSRLRAKACLGAVLSVISPDWV